jgi:iron complex outermembrane receptor protein
MSRKCALFVLWSAFAAFGQQPAPSTRSKVSAETEVVVVTGTFEPVPLSESNRLVLSLDTQSQSLLYNSVIDYLTLDPSIDLGQRGQGGTQADLSIRGATFEQSLVLLNGLRINDAQTGHHDMDIPIPLETLARIEVLHGSGSTLYGADALGGAVNFITRTPPATEVRVKAGFGNFGFNQQRVAVALVRSRWSEQMAGSRDFSTGFRPDRDYRSSSASSETRFTTALGTSDILFAGSDRPYGADQFYGSFNSWERTKSWFVSGRQELGKSSAASFGYRRHSDDFILIRDNPSIYENNHVSQSWQAAIRRRSAIGNDVKVSYGLDSDGDKIDSNNLGIHARNREAGYVNVDLQSFKRLFLSLGARDEIFSGGRSEFAPTVSAGVWIRNGLRLRASASRAFRLPTYTDLYYSDPANIGNPLLKPESAWGFEAGPEWNAGKGITAQLTVFNRRERNDIDYVRDSPSSPWKAMNVSHVVFWGVEGAVHLRLPKSQEIGLAYTSLTADQQVGPGETSKYVFNYPSHNAVFTWTGQFGNILTARSRVGATQRVGHGPYAVWDISVMRSTGAIRPYLQLTNLTDASYQSIPDVVMPGRAVVGGVEFRWSPSVRVRADKN